MQPSLVRSGTVHLSKAYDGSETLAELADERRLLPPELVHLLRGKTEAKRLPRF